MRTCSLLVLAVLPTGAILGAPLPKPEPGLELRLATNTPRVKRGEVVRWEVTITNRGKHEVTLVQPGDGSGCGWRTPIIEWVVNGNVPGLRSPTVREKKEETPAKEDRLPRPACLGEGFARAGRCGNINSLVANEVFVLKPGERVTLNAWVGGSDFLHEAGTYKVALRYFHIPALPWKGVPLSRHDPTAMDRIRQSGPVTLESNAVEVVVHE